MARILTGIQSSGRPHLGNILGAIRPAIRLSEAEGNQTLLFIADYHSLTSIRDGETREENVYAVAAAWLACGFDAQNNLLYKQSDLPEVAELAWYLSCFTPYPMLSNAHSFKDKSDRLAEVNAGLFTYPVLMAADILLYGAEVVPVGKDQKQHLEMTRDIAAAFNNAVGEEVFVLPEPRIDENLMTIPGTDGQKMSKSYNNYIDIFLPEKELKKQVMSIETDSTPLEAPKNPDTCNVFQLYSLVAPPPQIEEMYDNYRRGNYGYGHAKKALLGMLLEEFAEERKAFHYYLENREEVDRILEAGKERARALNRPYIERVRELLGFRFSEAKV